MSQKILEQTTIRELKSASTMGLDLMKMENGKKGLKKSLTMKIFIHSREIFWTKHLMERVLWQIFIPEQVNL